MTYDVLVAGGGPAGIVAAIQAARAGSRTLLIERSARLGGTTVNAGVNRPESFGAWGKPLIRGIGWELVTRSVEESGVHPASDVDSPIVDIDTYAALCDELVLDSGAELLLHTMPASVRRLGSGWDTQICGIDGLRTVRARTIIDATGDASVVGIAGLPRRRPAVTQPATLNYRIDGYVFEQLELELIDASFRAAVADGELKGSDGCWFLGPDGAPDPVPTLTRFLRSRGRGANHVAVDGDAASAEGRTLLEIEGRRSLARLRRFLKRQPGLENIEFRDVRQEVGVRETVTIVGRSTITGRDYTSGRRWRDALCYAFYALDRHGIDAASWRLEMLDYGVMPEIPVSAMIPANSSGIIVAGRSVSSDDVASSALRVQASAMAMGQVAGAVAHLAADHDVELANVPLEASRELLRDHGAIVPPEMEHDRAVEANTIGTSASR
jgi:hypothetical protein